MSISFYPANRFLNFLVLNSLVAPVPERRGKTFFRRIGWRSPPHSLPRPTPLYQALHLPRSPSGGGRLNQTWNTRTRPSLGENAKSTRTHRRLHGVRDGFHLIRWYRLRQGSLSSLCRVGWPRVVMMVKEGTVMRNDADMLPVMIWLERWCPKNSKDKYEWTSGPPSDLQWIISASSLGGNK